MIKEDQTAYQDWVDTEGKSYNGPHHLPWQAACAYKDKRIAELKVQVADGLEFARQTYTRARLMDQKTPMMLKLLSRIERLLETLELEGGADECEWKETDEAPYPRQSYRSACGYQHVQVSGIREMSGQSDKMILTATDCPKCRKPIHISEGGGDD